MKTLRNCQKFRNFGDNASFIPFRIGINIGMRDSSLRRHICENLSGFFTNLDRWWILNRSNRQLGFIFESDGIAFSKISAHCWYRNHKHT
jgi:hypothetical protein